MKSLPGSLHALGEDRDELVLLEQAQRVVGRGHHAADLAQQHRDPGQVEGPVQHEEARVARQRVLAQDRRRDHRAVPREDPGVVRHEQGAAVRGHVLHAGRGHAPPAVVEEVEHRLDQVGELLVEAPLVLLVVAVEPPQRRGHAVAALARQPGGAARQRLGQLDAGVEPLAQAAHEAERGAGAGGRVARPAAPSVGERRPRAGPRALAGHGATAWRSGDISRRPPCFAA